MAVLKQQEVKMGLWIIVTIFAVSTVMNLSTFQRLLVQQSPRETAEYDSKYLYQLASKQYDQFEDNDYSQTAGSKDDGILKQNGGDNIPRQHQQHQQQQQHLQILDTPHTSNETTANIWCAEEIPTLHNTMSKRDVEILTGMAEKNMCLSYRQQKKFVAIKDKALAWIHSRPEKAKTLLYSAPVGKLSYAVVLNEKYAFRHIFKNGGTTVSTAAKRGHVNLHSEELQNRLLVSVVRDPIDHFLSGWAECGSRSPEPEQYEWFSPANNINERVLSWVEVLRRCVETEPSQRGSECRCSQHSYPQATFLLDPTRNKGKKYHDTFDKKIDPSVEMVGDLRDIHGMLQMAGLEYDPSTIPHRRSTSKDPSKATIFDWDKDMLSAEVLRSICEFVMVDYYLFEFEAPVGCRDEVRSHIDQIEKVVLYKVSSK